MLTLAASPAAWAINGDTLAVRSNGFDGGTSWTIQNNGYVGTYIDVPAAGNVTISVNAAGTASGGIDPRMNIVVADYSAGFDVPAGSGLYEHTFFLPAGKHFVRTEFDNDPGRTSRQLSVQQFSVSGAAINNSHTSANALTAANNYIANFRKGPAEVALLGATPGAPVHVKLVNHAFNFGANFPGPSATNYFGTPGFTNFLRDNFNALVPSNGGKWSFNEETDQDIDLGYANQIRTFAEANEMRYRMHALAWGTQNPDFIQDLLDSAAGGNTADRDLLRAEISERIDYYVGDGDANTNDGDPANRYYALDVLNEHWHQEHYFEAFTPTELAGIFNEVKQAADASGNSEQVKLFLNEYNVLQNGEGDSFGNWYRAGADDIVNAGGHVDGLGVQYYARGSTVGGQAHSPARILQTLQNLSVGGFALTLTEFGIQENTSTVAERPTIVEESMRMVFGTPQMDGYFHWGFWGGGTSSLQSDGILMGIVGNTVNFTLTDAGVRYQQLMNEWSTELDTNVLPDGTIDFTGFYGEYEITIGGQTYTLDLTKGDTEYQLVVGPPSADFDLDGDVDGVDFLTWQANLGAINAAFAQGDANYDGTVTAADLGYWESQYDPAALQASSTSIPEPGSVVLVLLATQQFSSRRRN